MPHMDIEKRVVECVDTQFGLEPAGDRSVGTIEYGGVDTTGDAWKPSLSI